MLALFMTSITITSSNVQAATTNTITILTNDYWTVTMSNDDNYIGTVNGKKIGKKYEKDYATATISGKTLKITGTKQGSNTFYIYKKKGTLARTVHVTVRNTPSITSQTNQYANVGASKNASNIYLYEGDRATASIVTSGWYSSISWTSSNTSVATVSGSSTVGAVATKAGAGTEAGATSNITVTLKAATNGTKGTYTLTRTFVVHVYKKPILDVIIEGASIDKSYTMNQGDVAIVRAKVANADKLNCSFNAQTNSANTGYINLTSNSSFWELTMPEEGGLILGGSAKFTMTAKFSAGDEVTSNNGAYSISKEIEVIRGLSELSAQYIQLQDKNGKDIVDSGKIIYLGVDMPGYKFFDIKDTYGTITDKEIYVEDKDIVQVVPANSYQSKCEYMINGKKEGTTTITITTRCGNVRHERVLTVVSCSSIKGLKVEDMSLTTGETSNVTILGKTEFDKEIYKPVLLKDDNITFSSSDESIVAIEDGKLVAKKTGVATITATYSYYLFTYYYPNGDMTQGLVKFELRDPTVEFKVKVCSLISDMKFSAQNKNITKGKTISVLPTVYPQDEPVNTNYKWTSSDTAVATVSSDGTVTGKSIGKAVITATATDGSGKSASYTIYVKNISPTGIKAVSKKNGVYIRWTGNAETSTYKIYRATSKNGSYSQIGIATGLEYVDKSALLGKVYYYKIVATPSIGAQYESDFSNVVYTQHKLTTPKIKKIKKKKKGCKFKVLNASYDGYIIYLGKKKKTTKIYGTSKKKSITINIKKKGKYYVRVRAYKTVNGKFVYSNYSKARRVKIK